MATIEVFREENGTFRGCLRMPNGQIDAIAGSWDSQRDAIRGCQNWKALVKSADIKFVPTVSNKTATPPPLVDAPDDESIHATEDDDDDDDDEDVWTAEELVDNHTKAELVAIAEEYGVSIAGTKVDIAKRIVDAQG